MLYPAAKS